MRSPATIAAPRGARVFLIAAVVLLVGAVTAQATTQTQTFTGFTGDVRSITEPDANGVRYVGGEFRSVNTLDTGFGVAFDLDVGVAQASFPKVDGGMVRVSISDGAGGFYVGGQFTCIGALNGDGDCLDAGEFPRAGLARIAADGTVTAWNPGVSGGMMTSVYALALSGTTLYVGGDFTTIGGAARSRIAALDTAQNTNNATTWNPGVSGGMMTSVYALALSGTTLYVGGDFTTLGGAARNRIGALSTASNAAAAWNPGANNAVKTLALAGTTLYAGGQFTTIGGSTRNRIAALDTASDTNNATTWNPGAGSTVNAVVVAGSVVYVGGDFTTLGGATRNRIGAVPTTSSAASAWDPNANNSVFALALSGTTLYAGGYFSTIGGQSRASIAALDTTVDANMATGWAAGTTNGTFNLSISGSLIYAGGNFQTSGAGGLSRNYLAAVDANGELTAWGPPANNAVLVVHRVGDTIYVGGDFTTIGGVARNHIAALSADGTVLPWDPNVTPGGVSRIAVQGTKMVIGGYFTAVGGVARTNLAMISLAGSCATTFTDACVTSWNPPTTNAVNPGDGADVDSIAITGTTALIGGRFTAVDGEARGKLAAISISDSCASSYSKASCLLSWDPQGNGGVKSIAVVGSTAYVGGEFTTMAGSNRARTAALDIGATCLTSWTNACLASGWDPGASNSVRGMAVSGSTLYIGGDFTAFGAESRNRAVAVGIGGSCATTYVSACLGSWNPNANNRVETIEATGPDLLLGGSFTTLGGSGRGRFAAVGADGTVRAALPTLAAPTVPTAVTATATGTSASVAFGAPAATGSSAVVVYTATCTSTTGGASGTQTGAGSPLTVASLTPGATYACGVVARSAAGDSPAAAASGTITIAGGDGGGGGEAAAASDASALAGSGVAATATGTAARRPTAIRQTVVGANRLVVRIRVPSAGVLRVVGTMPAARRGRVGAVSVCSVTRRVDGAGVPWVVCGLPASVRMERQTRAVRLKLTATFTSSDGSVQRSSRTVTLSRLQASVTPLLG